MLQNKEIICVKKALSKGRILKFLTKNKGYKQFSYFCVMRGLKVVFDFYINASIHIALAVVSLLSVTGLLLSIEVSIHLVCFVFFSTISCYNFIKYGVEAKKYVLVAKQYHKNIQLISILSLVISLYNGFYLSKEAMFGCVVLIVLTGIYALPVLPNSKNFRDFGGLKILPVALVWAGITVVIPVLNLGIPLTWDIAIEAVQRIVIVLILLIPFEIRDLKYDSAELQTLPQRYGVTKSKIFGTLAIVFFFTLTYLKDTISVLDSLSKGVLFLILGVLMFVTKRNQSKYFASFWVEGIPILWLGIIFGIYLLIQV